MKRKYVALMLCVALGFSLMMSSCGFEPKNSGSNSSTKKQGSGQSSDFDSRKYIYEQDGAEPVIVPHNEEDFVGSWSTTSDFAEYLYGNVDLKINSNHTWSGNITDEDFGGKWTSDGEGITIQDVEGIIKWHLFFADNGQLMFENLVRAKDVALVLERTS